MTKSPKGDRKTLNLQLEPEEAIQSLSREKYEHSETALFRACRKYWEGNGRGSKKRITSYVIAMLFQAKETVGGVSPKRECAAMFRQR